MVSVLPRRCRPVDCLCVALSSALLVGTMLAYVCEAMPRVVDLRSWGGRGAFVAHSWLAFNLLFNYAMVVVVPPGKPSPNLLPPSPSTTSPHSSRQPFPSHFPWLGWRHCGACGAAKPPRAHHCTACGECVLRMDHHCPWVGRCIGYQNLRYFICFLLYLFLTCGFACGCILLAYYGDPLWEAPEEAVARSYFQHPPPQQRGFGVWGSGSGGYGLPAVHGVRYLRGSRQTAVTFTFIVSASMVVVGSILLSWCGYLVLSNQTTVEFLDHSRWAAARQQRQAGTKKRPARSSSPFDVGVAANVAQVFGPWRWWAVEVVLPRTGDLPAVSAWPQQTVDPTPLV